MAADVITRFKLETTQYDSRLRDASKALSNYTKQAELAGKQFGEVTQKNVEVAQSLGKIATSATNTKDKVKELVDAYNNVAKAYNALTDEQKKSDFGKAMAESLNTLQGRIKEAKNEMNSTGGILGQLKEKFTINIDAIKLFNAGLTAAKAALDVAKDAFFASEANVDEWGRTIAASESLYQGFLTALNTGDISGYLSRIDQIVSAARTAYNELDRLGTMKTIQAPQMSAQQTENDRMRLMLQTGRYIAPLDGRRNAVFNGKEMQNGDLLSPGQLRYLERQLQGGMNKMVTLVGNEVKQTGKAINALYDRQSKELGLSMAEFKKGTSSMAEFDKRMEGYAKYLEFEAKHTTTATVQTSAGAIVQSRRDSSSNPFAEYAKWGAFRVDGDRYAQLVNLIKQGDQQASQAYSMQSQMYRAINRAEGVTVKGLMGGGGGGKGGAGGVANEITYAEDSIAAMEAEVQMLTRLWKEASAAVRDDYKAALDEAQLRLNEITGKTKNIAFDSENAARMVEISRGQGVAQTSGLGSITSFANYQIPKTGIADFKELPTDDIEAMNKALKEQQMAFNLAGQAATNFGAALAGMGDPAAKAAGTVVAAIANIASGFAMASANANTAGTGWGWLAWLAAGMSAMATTISTIHSVTGFAEGGMIKGNSYSGDNIMANGGTIGLNAGEVVLNHAQQKTLARDLEEGGFGNLNIKGVLTGENIMLALDRHLQRSGQGELAIWR